MSDTPLGARVPAPPSQSPRLDVAAMARRAGLTRMPQAAQSPKLDLLAEARKLGITRADAPAQSPRLPSQ